MPCGVTQGLLIGGGPLPPHPHGYPSGAPKRPPLRLPPLVVGTVGLPYHRILGQGDPPWIAAHTPKTLHMNATGIKKAEIDTIR
jgi:hypothetical protein